MNYNRGLLILCSSVLLSTPVSAQTGQAEPLAQEAEPPTYAGKAAYAAALRRLLPDPASIQMPKLEFKATVEDEANYDKYYYFNRAGTGFAEALADLRDCDGLARGLGASYGYIQPTYPYAGTMSGVLVSAIGNALATAIFGSAQKRQTRRTNMRRCMHYKGYGRYGLAKDLWVTFNFEEGFSGLNETKRQAFLFQQAKVASGPQPATKELGI